MKIQLNGEIRDQDHEHFTGGAHSCLEGQALDIHTHARVHTHTHTRLSACGFVLPPLSFKILGIFRVLAIYVSVQLQFDSPKISTGLSICCPRISGSGAIL